MTLRELLERERDRAAEALVESFWGPRDSLEEEEQTSFDVEKSQYRHGFNHALELLLPVVDEVRKLREKKSMTISLRHIFERLDELNNKLKKEEKHGTET